MCDFVIWPAWAQFKDIDFHNELKQLLLIRGRFGTCEIRRLKPGLNLCKS